MTHCYQNYTQIYKNHVMFPYETHTFHLAYLHLHQLNTGVFHLKQAIPPLSDKITVMKYTE